MNKAVPWNVNGVGFNAREAAREAARRQGKSLGEWLHGVIADHAADIGVEEHEIAGRQRVEAVTSKLERLSARTADHERRTRGDGMTELPRRRTRDDDDVDGRDDPRRFSRRSEETAPRRRRESVPSESTELLLEEAIDAMERRASRAERQTENALQSFTKLLERNEADRDRERESVRTLADKLSTIETRLSDRMGQAEDNPIKGALARLESRLEAIGRRSAAEAAARPQPTPITPPEPFHRLEEKLNSILHAVHANPPQPIASMAFPAIDEPKPHERQLDDAIANITKRQHALDGRSPEPISLKQAILRRGGAPAPAHRDVHVAGAAPFATMQNEIAALATTIENLRRDVVEQRQDRPLAALDRDGPGVIESKQTQAKETHDDPRARSPEASRDVAEATPDLGDVVAGPTNAMLVGKIEDRLEALAAKIDQAVITGRDSSGAMGRVTNDFGKLEAMVRDLGRKMEAVQAPGAGQSAVDALEKQVALLSARFDKSDDGLDKLTSLERSMRQLFAHLEETRANVDTASTRAAREVLRIAMEEGRAQTEASAATNLATIQALHEDAEARTASTLNAVHGTLAKVVDRLTAMETDIAEGHRRPAAAAPEVRIPEPRISTARVPRTDLADRVSDPILDHRPGETLTKAPAPEPRRNPLDLDDVAGRADFIAAARRAAKVAQTDPALMEMNRPGGAKAQAEARAGLIAQSRDYVTKHKRPVLLSIAALFVVLGTMAIIQRIGFDGGEQVADTAAPAQSASMDAPAAKPRTIRRNDELSPSTLPTNAPAPLANPIPGSDPIQTGSISSLPAFAASATSSRPRPALPSNLRAMADSGDGAAEYLLGAQYAEGKNVPRDFTQAAKWYEKAAAQNLAPAQYRLASLYEKGLGVQQDKMKAKALYLQAAEAGNPRAMHNLAVLLADGDGKPDYDGAATWFRKAAQYGIHDSQYNLAILLARGIGVQQSFVQSYQWFAIAAAQGDTDAAKKRDEVADKLNANDLAVAKALASSFHPRTADVAATDVQLPPGA